MHKSLAAIALLVAALVPHQLAAQTPPAPLVKPEGLKQVSAHVHIIPDNSVQLVPNVGIIVGERAALVVDTGMGPRNGAVVLAEAQKLAGSRALFLVVTHFHAEHDLGAHAFPASTKMIRSFDQQKDIDEFKLSNAQNFASRAPIYAELLKDANYRKADINFETDYDLDLGGVRVKISALGSNHTRGDTAIWVEPDRILFAGDVAMRAQPAPSSPYSSLRQWLSSLDRLESLKPVLIVPSHGPTGDNTTFITGYRAYLNEVRDRTAAEKKAGRSADQTVETVTAAMAARFPDRARLGAAIRIAYAEAP
jgi:glyoxylase-like metal-dependent hydrolase (beta-lactamase superfamily II)